MKSSEISNFILASYLFSPLAVGEKWFSQSQYLRFSMCSSVHPSGFVLYFQNNLNHNYFWIISGFQNNLDQNYFWIISGFQNNLDQNYFWIISGFQNNLDQNYFWIISGFQNNLDQNCPP